MNTVHLNHNYVYCIRKLELLGLGNRLHIVEELFVSTLILTSISSKCTYTATKYVINKCEYPECCGDVTMGANALLRKSFRMFAPPTSEVT